jgi:hypothetical protein
MYNRCEQCGKYHWAKRSTKRFCDTACRVAFNRGQEPKTLELPEYQNEQIATLLAEHNKDAFRKLEQLRDYNGHRALNLALDAIRIIIKRDIKYRK